MLHQASLKGHVATVKELLAAGANNDVPDEVRWACLLWVPTCVRGRVSSESVVEAVHLDGLQVTEEGGYQMRGLHPTCVIHVR